jgi:hypothetical protein
MSIGNNILDVFFLKSTPMEDTSVEEIWKSPMKISENGC